MWQLSAPRHYNKTLQMQLEYLRMELIPNVAE
jgi:hypothetical protein